MERHKSKDKGYLGPTRAPERRHRHDGPIPPGADDMLGLHGVGGETIGDETETDAGPTDLLDTPDPSLVAVAKRLGVEDADDLDREALLDRLSPIRHGRKR
ncbi:MAG: hypothetical protein KY455_00650 [Euryarchaeota archaeon]|nr:hypothetical protein [Euryarchaeota archaeon]